MDSITNNITKSEINYGIISMRHTDGTYTFFQTLPERFTVNLRGKELLNRKVISNKLWIGYTKMRQFEVNETIQISKNGTIVSIN